MELTHREKELLEKYRALDPYSQGRVEGHLDFLLMEKREREKSNWTVCRKGDRT